MMNLLGFIMSLVYMQAVHGWLSTYERLVNSQKFFSPYLTQEDISRLGRHFVMTSEFVEKIFPTVQLPTDTKKGKLKIPSSLTMKRQSL